MEPDEVGGITTPKSITAVQIGISSMQLWYANPCNRRTGSDQQEKNV